MVFVGCGSAVSEVNWKTQNLHNTHLPEALCVSQGSSFARLSAISARAAPAAGELIPPP